MSRGGGSVEAAVKGVGSVRGSLGRGRQQEGRGVSAAAVEAAVKQKMEERWTVNCGLWKTETF